MKRAAAPRLLARSLAVALCLTGCGATDRAIPAATARPMRVMSMNLCTDQLVLALLPPERIASVTWLARDPGSSLMAAEAQKVGINYGLAEDVIEQKPDLVIAGSFTTPATRGMLKRLHYPMIEAGFASSFDDVRALTRQIAAAVGEKARGETMIARMDRTLAGLARDPAPKLRVASWDRIGFSAAKGTLQDAILEAAGARNIANEPPATSYGKPDAEVLLKTAPALLVQGSPYAHEPSLGDLVEQHRVVRRYWGKDRMLTMPQAYYACGTPQIADAAVALRDQMRRAAAAARAPLPFAGRTQ